jgi:carbonic anhydrase/acetyltransferase-like protein (isoleucine patch superfamily)
MKVELPVCKHLTHPKHIDNTVFVAPGAIVLGNVRLEANVSVWYQAVLRADIEAIEIGPGSNIQDGVIIHLASDRGTKVGTYVSCGHRAILHACTIGDEVLVGMGAIVMDGAEVGARSIIAAGALVPRGKIIPPGSLVMGSPGRVVRALDKSEQAANRAIAEKYIQVAREHRDYLAAEENLIPSAR